MRRATASDYGRLDYYSFCFDDLWASHMTLFVVWAGNNWHVVMSGAEETAGVWLARGYFISFYIVTHYVFSNVIAAFIVDCMDMQV